VGTDFEAHGFWMDNVVDLYCVAAPETKAGLVACGAKPDQVVVTGIPIAAKFSTRPQAHRLQKDFGLRDDLPVLFVFNGGFGMGTVAEILGALGSVERPFPTPVVAGRDEKLRRTLAGQDCCHPTRVFGFATNMHGLIAVACLVIAKPGGFASSEALTLGKPLFILNPIPGQETANSDFPLERGAAAKVNRIEDLPFRLEQLVGSRKLPATARTARKLGHPNAAVTIRREIV
jgi:processive 1,2-diacylglycerol beta-glucosyltransferase